MAKPVRRSLGKGLGALIRTPEKSKDDDERRTSIRTYRNALERALGNGSISADEQEMLHSMRQDLDISEEKHRKLERIVRKKLGLVDEERKVHHREGKGKTAQRRPLRVMKPSLKVKDAEDDEVIWDVVSDEEREQTFRDTDGDVRHGKKRKGVSSKGKKRSGDENVTRDRAKLAKISEYFNKGTELFKEERYEQAIEYWKKVLELNPDYKVIRKAIEKAENKLADQRAAAKPEPKGGAQPTSRVSVESIKAPLTQLLDDMDMKPEVSKPVRSKPVRSKPVRSEPVRPEPVRSEPVRPEPVRPEPVRPEPVRSVGPEAVEPEGPEAVEPEGPQAVGPEGPEAMEPEGPEAVGPEGPEAVGPEGPEAVVGDTQDHTEVWKEKQSDIKSELEALKKEALMDMMAEEKAPAPGKLEGIDFIRTGPGEAISREMVQGGSPLLKGPAQERDIPSIVAPEEARPHEEETDEERLHNTLEKKKDLEAKRREKMRKVGREKEIKDLFETAVKLGEAGRFNEAVIYLDKVLEIDPENVEALNDKGMCLYQVSKVERAVTTYRKALELEPAYKDALVNLGVAYNRMGMKKEALDAYTNAIRIDGELEEAWYNKGVCFFSAGRYQEAESCFSKAAQLNHDSEDAWAGKAYALEKLARFEEAKDTYDLVLGLNPSNEDAITGKNKCMEEIRKVLMADYI